MIFPDLPKHYTWQQYSKELVLDTVTTVKTPLHGVEETAGPSRISVEEWWIAHGLATDPAAIPTHRSRNEPIDYWAKDALEFYALCLGIVCWIVYWYGVHHGAW